MLSSSLGGRRPADGWPTTRSASGKMSKRAYHWLQTYCLHCHINLIQKLSKGPLSFTSAFTFFFFLIFGGGGYHVPQTSCSEHVRNPAGESPLPRSFTPPLKQSLRKRTRATNLKWTFPNPNTSHPHGFKPETSMQPCNWRAVKLETGYGPSVAFEWSVSWL